MEQELKDNGIVNAGGVTNQEIHAGRILLLLIVAYFFEDRFPLVALLLATTAIMITFTKISNRIKKERL